ncbi:MAG: Uma2 family endonuclease [Hyphomicrobiales bacterium]|nr:Uma2 family endonuclease [Hyphomicrobiales bacterium]
MLTAWSCAPPVDRTATVIHEPVVVFEILSPSTAANDRIVKAREYQATPSIRRYVMLEQDSIGATAYARAGDSWTHEILIADSILALPEIGVEIPLAEFYEGIVFDDKLEDDEPRAEETA